MSGILFGVGVGPGDPELMTIKACRVIRENEVIAVPGETAEDSRAFQIAVQAVPGLRRKTIVPVSFPMTMDREKLEKNHRQAAAVLESFLQAGQNVVFLTVGDVSLYSTFSYVQRIVRADGFETRMISGVPSFCAAAASIGEPLAEGREAVNIIPGIRRTEDKNKEEEHLHTVLPADKGDAMASDDRKKEDVHGAATTYLPETSHGTQIFLKAGSRLSEIKKMISSAGRDITGQDIAEQEAYMVENCGMPDEKVYRGEKNFPDKAGYFSLVIARSSRRHHTD